MTITKIISIKKYIKEKMLVSISGFKDGKPEYGLAYWIYHNNVYGINNGGWVAENGRFRSGSSLNDHITIMNEL